MKKINKTQTTLFELAKKAIQFLKNNWIGIVIIFAATIIYFFPTAIRMGSYIDGGDAMFNAWTLSRNHHCIMRENCTDYTDANIYFPNKDTMLYSESQLSAGLLTLPIYAISKNPIVTYNFWTIMSFFLAGLFMYFLAKYLSKGHLFIAIVSGLVFEFASPKIFEISHLQNLSIFYLPLIVLFILKYIKDKRTGHLLAMILAMVLFYYASWYQAVFGLIAISTLLLVLLATRFATKKQIAYLFLGIFASSLVAIPLALQYTKFSKETSAKFSISEQLQFSASLGDYAKPFESTILGKIYYSQKPKTVRNGYNTDNISYQGIALSMIPIVLLGTSIYQIKKSKRKFEDKDKLLLAFAVVAIVGILISLGPLLKVFGSYTYGAVEGIKLAIPLPWLLVDKFLPQLAFIRAIGRASIVTLFAFSAILALVPLFINEFKFSKRAKIIIYSAILIILIIEIMPTTFVRMGSLSQSYNIKIPKVYEIVKNNKDINNIIILSPDGDYPGAGIPTARVEQVLWAGYHNKNIFNGYSGYTPPRYFEDMLDFNDLSPDDKSKMLAKGIKFVILDKSLSITRPEIVDIARSMFSKMIYSDERYELFEV